VYTQLQVCANNRADHHDEGGADVGVADYDITVSGELAAEFAAAFAPHDVTCAAGTTTIRALRVDDAGLLALMSAVGDLALSVVRVERLDDPHRTA
jgi:hypothetical protein